eukprot:339701_1
MSLAASLFSIANKYTWIDKECVVDDAREIELSKNSPYINKWYVLRAIWRFSYVMARFCILSLIWSVLGGAFVGIFLFISWLIWVIVLTIEIFWSEFKGKTDMDCVVIFAYIAIISGFGFSSLVASPSTDSIIIMATHGIEMIFSSTIITIFASTESIDCSICADPVDRQATNNPYILMFLLTAWIAMSVDFIGYFIMMKFERFDSNGAEIFNLFEQGTNL